MLAKNQEKLNVTMLYVVETVNKMTQVTMPLEFSFFQAAYFKHKSPLDFSL